MNIKRNNEKKRNEKHSVDLGTNAIVACCWKKILIYLMSFRKKNTENEIINESLIVDYIPESINLLTNDPDLNNLLSKRLSPSIAND